jgi:hypothetical protein
MSNGWKPGTVAQVFGVQLRDIVLWEQLRFCFLLTTVHFVPELQFCFLLLQWKMDVTFCKCNCHSFTLCLPYAKLTSYSTEYMQISNDAKLIMADGAYQDL